MYRLQYLINSVYNKKPIELILLSKISSVVSRMSYSGSFFEFLQKQRHENNDCDVTVICEEDEYPAHKFVLGTASLYFDKLFTVDMKDKGKDVVQMTSVSSPTFKVCMEHMYNGEVTLTSDNVDDVLAAACFFQLWSLRDKCFDFKKREMSLENCLEFYQLIERFNAPKFVEVFVRFIGRNFDAFIKSNLDWLVANGSKEMLTAIFSSNDLLLKMEDDLWNILLKWVEQDREYREKEFCDLFKLIRLLLISELRVLLDISFNKLVTSCEICTEIVKTALLEYHKKNELKTERNYKKVLIINERLTRVGVIGLTNGKEKHGTSLTPPEDCNYPGACFNIVLMKSHLFVFGRKNLYVYDFVVDSRWKCLAKIPEGHKFSEEKANFPNMQCLRRPGVILHDGSIFLVSGRDSGCKIDIFDIASSCWIHTFTISQIRVTNFCLNIDKEQLYVIGGLDFQNKASKVIYCINIDTGDVASEKSMKEPRFDAAITTMNAVINIVGGFNIKEVASGFLICGKPNKVVEKFDLNLTPAPTNDRESQGSLLSYGVSYAPTSTSKKQTSYYPVQNMKFPDMKNCCSAIAFDECIYIFGGNRDEHQPLYEIDRKVFGDVKDSEEKAGCYKTCKVFLL